MQGQVESPPPRRLAHRARGIAAASSSAPTPLSSQRCAKSVESPSLVSIMAGSQPFFAKNPPKLDTRLRIKVPRIVAGGSPVLAYLSSAARRLRATQLPTDKDAVPSPGSRAQHGLAFGNRTHHDDVCEDSIRRFGRVASGQRDPEPFGKPAPSRRRIVPPKIATIPRQRQ